MCINKANKDQDKSNEDQKKQMKTAKDQKTKIPFHRQSTGKPMSGSGPLPKRESSGGRGSRRGPPHPGSAEMLFVLQRGLTIIRFLALIRTHASHVAGCCTEQPETRIGAEGDWQQWAQTRLSRCERLLYPRALNHHWCPSRHHRAEWSPLTGLSGHAHVQLKRPVVKRLFERQRKSWSGWPLRGRG